MKFAMWVEEIKAMRVEPTSHGWGTNIRTCAIWGSWEHPAEIECVVRPINYAPYTAMSKVYLHVRRCSDTSF